VNPNQAARILEAVGAQKRSGSLLLPFFATLYFAGLRPEEAVNLRKNDLNLPCRQARSFSGLKNLVVESSVNFQPSSVSSLVGLELLGTLRR
jgi:integrase